MFNIGSAGCDSWENIYSTMLSYLPHVYVNKTYKTPHAKCSYVSCTLFSKDGICLILKLESEIMQELGNSFATTTNRTSYVVHNSEQTDYTWFCNIADVHHVLRGLSKWSIACQYLLSTSVQVKIGYMLAFLPVRTSNTKFVPMNQEAKLI